MHICCKVPSSGHLYVEDFIRRKKDNTNKHSKTLTLVLILLVIQTDYIGDLDFPTSIIVAVYCTCFIVVHYCYVPHYLYAPSITIHTVHTRTCKMLYVLLYWIR